MRVWAMLCGVSLVCMLDLGQQSLAEEPSCGPRSFQRGTGTNARCCNLCAPGNIKFGFECVDCAMGTFSAGREGHCRPWADCAQFGFLTMFPGNKTHNAVCIPEPLPTEQHGHLAVIFLAMAACILFLTIAQLCLQIWQLRRQHMCPRETQPLLEVQLPPADDACSFQFPEEERGEQMEEKSHLGDQWP
ncbi:tumor necrosis factor receptor superfamily member 18 isoform X3 [Phodopus roborovskii]|uniref:tumor necrosis factor receptor superfamily member 18 isoform X3 n=1 Tax=Phodopus roborovskii TaxID=109678 RepID=UPI0021E4A257|nr:tumor necrosis factor receptor superfamily member 18 isoform X3 [Phodopus roborovskii]